MLKVKRANVILRIPDVDKQHYIDKGYSVIDEHGVIIEAAVPKDIDSLQKAFVESQEEIKRLNAEIEFLKNKLSEKKVSKQKVPKEPKE